MPGVEGVLVQWAPSVTPLNTPTDPDWVTLPDWQTIKTTGGQTITDVTQTFNIGTATIRLRNGDSTGRTPLFSPSTTYKGAHIRVFDPTTVGPVFRGRIDRPEFDYTETPFGAFVTLHCVDAVGVVPDAAVPDQLFPDTVDYFTEVATIADAFVAIMSYLGDVVLPIVGGETSNQLVKAPDKFESRQSLLDFLNQVLLTESATVYGTPTGDLQLRGRWDPLALLSAGAAAPIVFTDTAPDGVNTYRYRRDDLEWFDGNDSYVNSVQTRSKYLTDTATVESVPSGFPRIELSRTELVTIRQGWVDANAHMWFQLQTPLTSGALSSYPKKLKFMVASRGQFLPTFLAADSTIWPTFARQFQVLHTPPGDTQRTYRLAVDYVEHDINKERWLCTLGFTSLDYWWFAYGNGVDPIELVTIGGDAAHGIGSTAIIAP